METIRKATTLTIHRGSQEVGGTCVEVVCGTTRLVLDLGLPLVAEAGDPFDQRTLRDKSIADLLEQGLLPKITGLYSSSTGEKPVDAILISHAHLDHHGLLRYADSDIPVYLSPGTMRILEVSSRYHETIVVPSNSVLLGDNEPVRIGGIEVVPYLVDHSGFDARAFELRCGDKTIIYTGDFRGHGRKQVCLDRFISRAKKNADALLVEGTVVGQADKHAGYATEFDVEDKMQEIIQESDGLVFVSFSSQNIDRLVSAFKATRDSGRILLVDAYSAHVLDALEAWTSIPKPRWKEVKVWYPQHFCKWMEKKGLKNVLARHRKNGIGREVINANQDKYVLMYRPSMLRDAQALNGIDRATLIYSMWSGYLDLPGWEGTTRLFPKERFRIVHTSGHATVNDLVRTVQTLAAERVVPIHTFHPEEYDRLFDNVLHIEDEETFEL